MSRILTGIQATGTPHLGNVLGAIEPGIALSQKEENESFFFIADMHSLTTIKDPAVVKQNALSVAASWIACGFDYEKNTFYRQSDIPSVAELAWYLNCITPYPMLANAHSFKDKSDRLSDVNAGLFTYPVLMACDILLYQADYVPVGKDQKQHLEMTRDMGQTFNRIYGETFVIPEAKIDENVMIVPGVDGQKMSKSYNNFINLFTTDKQLKKQVMRIITDSKELDDPKDPDACNVFKIYRLVGTDEEVAEMRENYLAGGFGYGHAKTALLHKLIERYGEAREKYQTLMSNTNELEDILVEGAKKAAREAQKTLTVVREKVGFRA